MNRDDMTARAKFTAKCARPGCGWKLTSPVTAFTVGRRAEEHERWHRDREDER